MGDRSCLRAIASAIALASMVASAEAAPAAATHVVAYEKALTTRDYGRAAAEATAGCIYERDFASCRRLAALPIHIGNSGVAVPREVGERLKHAAATVCRSPAPFRDILGRDVTARECAHLAARFVLARDPEYQTALAAESARFFASIYEPARTAELTRASARRILSATIE
jgi:hypothetical protein